MDYETINTVMRTGVNLSIVIWTWWCVGVLAIAALLKYIMRD